MHRIRHFLVVCTLLLVASANAASAGSPGSAGLLFLRFGIDARSGAMGETGVATSDDASAVYWNPANLRAAPGTQMLVQHTEPYGLFRMESGAVSHHTPFGSFGLLLSGFYSEDIDRTELDRAGEVLGTFRPYDLVGGIAYAHDYAGVAFGMTAKVVYERIDAYSGSTFAFDFGVAHDSRIEGLRLAAALQNVGADLTLQEEDVRLPATIRMGASYRPSGASVSSWIAPVLGTVEVVRPNDGNMRLHAGLEYTIHDAFVVRGGHRFSYDTWGSTFGAGFRRGNLAVDYAFMANDNDFDATHRFSLRFAVIP